MIRVSMVDVGSTSMITRLALFVSLIQLTTMMVASALNPAIIDGSKFFDSVTGEEIAIRGIDYFPRPNGGVWNHNSIDFYTDEHESIWRRDLANFIELGVNAIRLYMVDPGQNHDSFMCALERAGIYVVVALAMDCPTCAVTRDAAPECYPPALKRRGQEIVHEFSKYSNTLAFSAGNEVNHFAPPGEPQHNGPCLKKFIRDMRTYIERTCARHLRKVPVGLVVADSDRRDNALYYNCRENPRDIGNAEWYGLNTYVSCNGRVDQYKDDLGMVALAREFSTFNVTVPVVLTEFGCLSDTFPTEDDFEGTRSFHLAQWLGTEPDLLRQFAGGFVFEYSIEMQNAKDQSPYPFKKFGEQNYGVGYFEPENCDDLTIPCTYVPMPSFHHLREAYRISNATGERIDIGAYDADASHRRQDERTAGGGTGNAIRRGGGGGGGDGGGGGGTTTCPIQFPPLDSFEWEADEMNDLSCPSRSASSSFTCAAVMAKRDPESDRTRALLTFLGASAFAMLLYAVYIWTESTSTTGGRRYHSSDDHDDDDDEEHAIGPPSFARRYRDLTTNSAVDRSHSDESTGLFSLKELDGEGRRPESRANYSAFDSDSSSEDDDHGCGSPGEPKDDLKASPY